MGLVKPECSKKGDKTQIPIFKCCKRCKVHVYKVSVIGILKILICLEIGEWDLEFTDFAAQGGGCAYDAQRICPDRVGGQR